MNRPLLTPTYRLAPNPPTAMEWDAYNRWLWEKWSALLNSDRQSNEKAFQDFLEQHPSLLPHFFGGHGSLHSAVFSQPELPGFRKKHPDFMWISLDSMN